MKVLILGGTGAMGAHLVDVIRKKIDNECFVTSRNPHQNDNNTKYIIGNAHDNIFLDSILESKWDVIVDFMNYSTEEFSLRVNKILNSTNQYFFLSSSRVYANNTDPLNEDSPRILDVCKDRTYLATDEYALAKARQENILFNNKRKNWTIIRPYITFSEKRLQLGPLEKEYWLYRALHGRTICFSRDLASRYTTLTYGNDVARGMLALMGKKSAMNQVFHITNNESFQWSEILNVYLNVLESVIGDKAKVYWIEQWEPFLGGTNAQIKFDRMYDRRFNNSKISEYIDVDTFKPTLLALKESLEHFIMHQCYNKINWYSEAQKDKLVNEWISFKEISNIKQIIKYLKYRLFI